MQLKSNLLFALVIVLGVLVKEGVSIKCYNCVLCNDPFDKEKYKSSTVDCSGSCSKTKAGDIVGRVCSPMKAEEKCTESGDNAQCFCNSELCNNAWKTQTSVTVILFCSISFFVRKYFF